MSTPLAIAIGAAIPAAALVVALVVHRRRGQQLARRVREQAARLAASTAPEADTPGAALVALERAVDAAAHDEREASTAAARLRLALTAIDDGVVLLDEHGDVVFTNDQADAFLGGRHGDVLVQSVIDELAAAALGGADVSRTLELFGPPPRSLVLGAHPLGAGGRSIGALVVVDDVTERRRVDAVRRDFVANISHELKTPVGGIGVLAEMLVDEEDLDVIRRLAGRMHLEAMRASHTIDDLLELSRIEAGAEIPRELVPVHAVLGEAVDRAAGPAERRGIAIELVPPAPELAVLGDRRQLASAVFNLIDNAVKYSPADSTVRVSAGRSTSAVQIQVADQGIGIPRRDLERIFERFYRVDRARSRDTGGTGLGLAIVRHVASNHGGEISVDSREGEGSTFVLSLPPGEQTARTDQEA